MKKNLIYCLLLYLIFATNSFPQEGWFQQNSGTNNPLTNLFFVDQNTGWIVGTAGTILRTTNGGTDWITESSGTNNDLFSVRFIDQSTGWATGGNGTILKTTDGGINWIFQTSGTNVYLTSVFFTDQNNGWVVGEDIVLKTTDGGMIWSFQTVGSGGYFQSIYFINQNTGWIVGSSGIFKTTDGGSNWISQTYGGGLVLVSVIFVDQNFGWIIGLLPVLPPPLPTYLYSTTNGGTDWISLPFNQGELKSVYFTDQFNGWAVSNVEVLGNISRTTDGGFSWTNQFSEVMNLNSVFFTDENTGWAVGYSYNSGTGIILKTINGGVPVNFTSFDGEVIDNEVILRWKTATETNNRGFEVHRAEIRDQKSEIGEQRSGWEKIGFVDGNGTTTEAKSYSFVDKNVTGGSYRYRLKQIDYNGSFTYSNEIGVVVNLTPDKYVLYQNYPNPFNPSTKIGYRLKESGYVKLYVYDIKGELIQTLVNQYQEGGYYEVEFSGASNQKPVTSTKNLASGIYIYQMMVRDEKNIPVFSDIKKMVFLK